MNEYKDDVSSELCDEVKHLKSNHYTNLVLQDADEQPARTLKPIDLLNKLRTQFEEFVSNLLRCLRMFCTLPVTMAEGERSFNSLARIKNYLRSAVCQDSRTDFGTLAIDSELGLVHWL